MSARNRLLADAPDPDTGMTRAEMRAARSPETRAFLDAMDRYKDDGDDKAAMDAFKVFLRSCPPIPAAPAAGLLTAKRTMYRSPIGRWGRPWRSTKLAAFRDYARAAWWVKHPCECDRGDDVTPPDVCEWHSGDGPGRDYRLRVVDRYARLLLRKSKATARLLKANPLLRKFKDPAFRAAFNRGMPAQVRYPDAETAKLASAFEDAANKAGEK